MLDYISRKIQVLYIIFKHDINTIHHMKNINFQHVSSSLVRNYRLGWLAQTDTAHHTRPATAQHWLTPAGFWAPIPTKPNTLSDGRNKFSFEIKMIPLFPPNPINFLWKVSLCRMFQELLLKIYCAIPVALKLYGNTNIHDGQELFSCSWCRI